MDPRKRREPRKQATSQRDGPMSTDQPISEMDTATRAAMARLRGAGVVHDVPADAPAPEYTLDGQSPMGELAEAALKFTGEMAQWNTPALELVNSESDATRAEAEQLLADISALDPEVRAALGTERDQLLAAIKNGTASAIDPERIRERIETVKADVMQQRDEQIKDMQTREAEMRRLIGEMNKLFEKAGKLFDELPTTKEEKDKRKELENAVKAAEKTGDPENIRNARLDLIKYYQEIGVKYDDPQLKRLAEELVKVDKEFNNVVKHKIASQKDNFVKPIASNEMLSSAEKATAELDLVEDPSEAISTKAIIAVDHEQSNSKLGTLSSPMSRSVAADESAKSLPPRNRG